LKLEQLSITGFGRLREIEVRFHPRVTVIFGENESGKSTLQRAVRAALYGLDAGGQGRAVDRSEWNRWKPWDSARYGLALTYALDDGRRFRVARRLDTREQSVQVLELGGRDVTDELRTGRAVAPGRFHLGLSEAVFAATAWLGEDGLRLGSLDAPAQRARDVQEAIERIVDSEGGITAAQAIALLRDAMERVGTERRLASPLGAATARLRDLDAALTAARERLASVSREQERLRELEARAGEAEGRRGLAERAWLVGRLSDLGRRIQQLEECQRETDEEAAVVAATRPFASFRTDDEERVIGLGVEITQAALAAAEAQKRWEASAAGRETVRRRRAEIAAGLRALGPDAPRGIDEAAVRKLHDELSAAAAGWARLDTAALLEERRAALRREIAGTGLGDARPEALESLVAMLPTKERRPRLHLWAWPGTAAVATALAVSVALWLGSRPLLAAAALLAAVIGAFTLAAVVRRASREQRSRRRRQLAELERSGISRTELEELAERLPSLRALRAALTREEALGESRRIDAAAMQHEAFAVYSRCLAAAVAQGVSAPLALSSASTVEAHLDGARELLGRIDAALAAQRRRRELSAEDRQLTMTELALDQVQAEVERTRSVLAEADRRLRAVISGAGLAPARTPAEAVAAFRDACGARRRHDEALRAHEAVQRRAAALGADAPMLRRSWDHYAAELQARGGDAAEARSTPPLDSDALRRLEMDAAYAAREASLAFAEAKALRARLHTLMDAVPDVADLEDERSSCAAARQRGVQQLAALQRAVELIETATRGAHRELAPRLAESLDARLGLLTGARYQKANVDTDHFSVSLLSRDRPDFLPLEVLSQGTRDQVSLLLRLALSEVLGSAGEPAPMLLDEPLLSSDGRRRRVSLEFLHEVSATHQVVITTNAQEMVADMQSIAGGDCALVCLGEEPLLETTGRLQPQRSPAMRTRLSSSDTSSVNSGIRAVGTPPSRSSRDS
jgi:DNA repair protein SbcC/Rad50